MGTVFQLNAGGVAPAPGTSVVRADEYAAFTEAADIVAAARETAAAIESSAREAFEERRREGYAAGLEEGRFEMACKMLETVNSSVEFIQSIENTVVDVVNQSVRKVIGELDDGERITRIVRTALASVRGRQQVLVRVSPADEPEVSRALAAMTASSLVSVVAEPRLSRDSCILESELGVVDASLQTQLNALETAFRKKIAK